MKNTDLTKMKNYLNKNKIGFSVKVVHENKTLIFLNDYPLRFAYVTIVELDLNDSIVGGFDLEQYYEAFTDSHNKAVNMIKEYLK